MPPLLDVSGKKFGRLTAVGMLGVQSNGEHMWICNCDCGNVTSVSVGQLRRGRGILGTKSCGCLASESLADGRKKGWLRGSSNNYRSRMTGQLTHSPGSRKLKHDQYTKQSGRCGLCGEPLSSDFRKAYFDHDHRIGKPRSRVHPRCNSLIGFIETSSPELIKKVYQYLYEHSKKENTN